MSRKPTLSQWLTVAEVAEVLGVSPCRVNQFLLAGRLRGEKFGAVWAIARAECDRFAKLPRPVGNPNLKKRKR